MLGLPKATEMNKQLPKKAIYAKFQMNTAAKAKIDADISKISIVNEITPSKVNIPAGEEVKSFFVLLVSLKRKDYEERTIGMPYPQSGVVRLNKQEKSEAVPIWLKSNLTLEEAAAYTGIGVGKLRELSDDEACEFVLWVGTKRLLKRKKLDEYLEKAYSI